LGGWRSQSPLTTSLIVAFTLHEQKGLPAAPLPAFQQAVRKACGRNLRSIPTRARRAVVLLPLGYLAAKLCLCCSDGGLSVRCATVPVRGAADRSVHAESRLDIGVFCSCREEWIRFPAQTTHFSPATVAAGQNSNDQRCAFKGYAKKGISASSIFSFT
jgi:hypothetical protein